MSYMNFSVLRFDNQIIVHDGIVSSDNENGKNGLVCLKNKSSIYHGDYFQIVNNPNILCLFKGTIPFELCDLKMCLYGRISTPENPWIGLSPNENCVLNIIVLHASSLIYQMDNNELFFNFCGRTCFDYLSINEKFENYINSISNQIIRVKKEKNNIYSIINVFTNYIYGKFKIVEEFVADVVYENDNIHISMKEVGITTFYDMMAEDIINNSPILKVSISSFDDLSTYFNSCNSVHYFDIEDMEDIKNIKVYFLYDHVKLKGKSTLIPCEDSILVGYFVSFGNNRFFGCPPCECGYIRVTENLFLKDLEIVKESFGVEPKLFRKNNINSTHFDLHRGDSIEDPKIFYLSQTGERIELLKSNAYVSFQD